MALIRAVGTGALVAISLSGCGESGPAGNSTTTPSAPVPTPTPTPGTSTTAPFPAPTPTPGKQDVHVVLRLDDMSMYSAPESSAAVVDWAVKHKIPLSFGVITSDWPSDCLTNPYADGCEQPSAQSVYKAYKDGHVKGTSNDAFLEICSHSHGHTHWVTNYQNKSWVDHDFECAGSFLKKAFPNADIRTFIAPETLADSNTLEAMLSQDFDIMSAQGQLGCNQSEGSAPDYNYLFSPCCDATGKGGHCVPPGDIYFKQEGMQKMKNGIISLPTGSANSHIDKPEIGHSVATTIGLNTCGCTGDVQCPLLQNAQQNARKSNGLWWTVLMMHPFTDFQQCCKQTYAQWLEEFLVQIRALKDYEVHFWTFQDLAKLQAPGWNLVV